MCTCPNYMIPIGTHVDKNMNYVPTYKFLGHHQFERIAKQGIPFIEVPCGQCLECRLQQTRMWSDRCVLEAKNSPFNYFVTLTYDDDHIPFNGSLNPKDIEQFINLLRKYFKRKLKFDGKIKYFLSGEYGSTSLRPHFHIILFNCPIPDLSDQFYLEQDGKLQLHLKPDSKVEIKHSMLIYDLWQRKGMISVEYFNYDAAAYVAQYVTKKVFPNFKKTFENLGLLPEFIRMSNGIGKAWFEEHPFCHDDGKLIVPCSGEAHKSSVPRYFDKLFIKKYGLDVFRGSIGSKRYLQRVQNVDTNLNKCVKYDDQCRIRDLKAHAIHHQKAKL